MEKQYRIALLIDGENVSQKYAKLITDEISEYGTTTYKRVYGDFTNGSVLSWKDNLRDYAMTPIFQFNYTRGKNASDSAMVIDAMDILYSGTVDGFCLVTSDSDFTKLAIRLREAGMLVIGMGEQKTPNSLVRACNTFKYLDLLYSEEEAGADGKALAALKAETDKTVRENETRHRKAQNAVEEGNAEAPKAAKNAGNAENASNAESTANAEIVENAENADNEAQAQNGIPGKDVIEAEIASIISSRVDEDGWVNLARIGSSLAKRVPGFDPRNYGYKKLKDFIECFGCFEIREITNPKNDLLKTIYIKMK